ncbi:MAG TPA: TonB-dependent receptor [Burkholderiaceae bacterium]|nr:TonB-dependent receptor [Burkholderiaceae bacterium]
MRNLIPAALAAALACGLSGAHGQQAASAGSQESGPTLQTVTVEASADASAQGLSAPHAGGQVARGGRAGILGTRDSLETPFSITSYTNELIQDRHARSVGEVLLNDPTVRVARGFGNFQETYFIRGFVLGSDDTAYNGLFGLLPRQYIATELFERVEVLRGASAFLTGAAPNGGGIGGTINLLPKRAPNEPLSRVTVGAGSGSQGNVAIDLARRFGPDQSTGLRFNAAYRDGGTGIDDEKARLGLAVLGADWRSRDARLSADIGWQDNRLKRTRPNVTLSGTTAVPRPPDASSNFAQSWTYSNSRDLFGTVRGEFDFSDKLTAYAAFGMRRSDEANSLGNVTLTNGSTGDGTFYRFDNTREDSVDTAEIGLRGRLRTGSVGHEWVISAAYFRLDVKNAFAWDFFNTMATSLYAPASWPRPDFSDSAFTGNDLSNPALNLRTRLTSFAVGDTLSMLDDRLLVTLGLRHQNFRQENFAYDTGLASDPYDDSRTSPMAGVVYKFGRHLSVYGNYVEGLVQGDTATGTPPPANNGEALAPYVSKQTEIGLKYDGGSLGASVALFSTSEPRSLIDANNVFTSEGENRHQGVELTVFGEATRSLRGLGGASWIHAEQRDTGSAATNGKRVIGVPRFQANLGAEWAVPGLQGLSIDGRVLYTGSSYADAGNLLRAPSWTRLDAGVRYLMDVGGHLLTLRARIDNLADRDYWASAGGFPGSGYLVVGAPRTFTLSASLDC